MAFNGGMHLKEGMLIGLIMVGLAVSTPAGVMMDSSRVV